jgi:hypothetical protein
MSMYVQYLPNFFISFTMVDKLDVTMNSVDLREGDALFVCRSPELFTRTISVYINRKINLQNETKG